MAVIISVDTDAFAETLKKVTGEAPVTTPVRRPLRGIQVKKDTYANIRIKRANGDTVHMVDAGAEKGDQNKIGQSPMYANFLVQGIREERAEKQQLIETFGEDYVYFFGERPRYLAVQGMLINTANFNWKEEWWYNYDNFFRGTKLVEQNARLYFTFDNTLIEGYMIGASTTVSSDNPHLMPLQFQIFITNYAQLNRRVGYMFPEASDTEDPYNPDTNAFEPILPSTTNEALAGTMHAGGLNSFLSKASDFVTRAEFSIQSTLETVRETLYGRQLIVPEGIGEMVTKALVTAKGDFGKAPTGPYWKNWDEYIGRESDYSLSSYEAALKMEAEQARINLILAKNEPAVLEGVARAKFEAAGIDTGTLSGMFAILGRGAFAVTQFVAPFALKKIGGGGIGNMVTQGLGG